MAGCSSCFGGWLGSTLSAVLSHAGPVFSFSWAFSDTGFKSSFSGGSSLRTRGRGSLVLPRAIKLVSPEDISSLSSFISFIVSCLKENTGILTDFGTETGSGFGGAVTSFGGSRDLAAGAVGVSSSEGITLLTTLRTTFTTFFRVPPSSVSSGWLALIKVLPLSAPLTLLSPFRTGSGLKGARGGSGLLNRSGILGTSEVLLTATLFLLGEGLLTRSRG